MMMMTMTTTTTQLRSRTATTRRRRRRRLLSTTATSTRQCHPTRHKDDYGRCFATATTAAATTTTTTTRTTEMDVMVEKDDASWSSSLSSTASKSSSSHSSPSSYFLLPKISYSQRVGIIFLLMIVVFLSHVFLMANAQGTIPLPQLNGRHFKITALQENGFLDILDQQQPSNNQNILRDDDDEDIQQRHKNLQNITFEGYLIDMIHAIAQRNRANFTFELLPPSGLGVACVPQIQQQLPSPSPQSQDDEQQQLYSAQYRTQYNCGAADVTDATVFGGNNNNNNNTDYTTTDMYLGMYYVTPSRQLMNQFTIPFLPPYSGTLAMFGTATHITNFDTLVTKQSIPVEQQLDNQGGVGVPVTPNTTCGPAGTALITEIQQAYPGLQVRGIYGGEDEIYQNFYNGSCTVYITDGPIAAQFVLRRSRQNQCTDQNGMPIGTIGDPMPFGLSHYAIGIRQDISIDVVNTLSYWMNILMTCNDLDPEGPCPDGNFASFYKSTGGQGDECGYVLYPEAPTEFNAGYIAGIFVASTLVLVSIYVLWHRRRLRRQTKQFEKAKQEALEKVQKERAFNEFLSHEIRNPLSSAMAALNFVQSKVSNPTIVPNEDHRTGIKSDTRVIDSSLSFVNELLRNMLDLQRASTEHGIKLHLVTTDVLKDIIEPVAAILFMRGANVEIQTDCPENLLILADRMRIKQILLNLANNACKFVEKGYVRIGATIRNDTEQVQLYVEDSGPGIPEDKRQNLFSKFQDSHDVLNQGTGLGLSLCKKLSLLMDATLNLDDDFDSGFPNHPGTRFVLELQQRPLAQENGNGKISRAASDKDLMPDLPENLTVLFVDDDALLRKMFTRVLRVAAPTWKIREASNGETALCIFDDEPKFQPDIIFIDQYMASVEKQLLGTETVHALRAKGVKSLICGLSANDVEDQFLKAGANYFVFKPFPCKKHELQRELFRLLASGDSDQEQAVVSQSNATVDTLTSDV